MSLPNHKYEKQPRTRVPRSWMAISTTCQLYKRLRQSTPFCPEFPKQHEKNLTEPPEKKKRHSGRKKLKWFKCPKTQTEYTELIDNTWAAERTHVSVAGWGNVTHFKRSTRSSDEVVTALCDPSGPKLFCPRHSLNRNISIDLYFRTFFNLHTQKARVGGGNVKKKQPSLYQEAERMVGKVKCLQLNICKRTEDSFQTSSWRQKLDIFDRKSITIWYFKPKRVFFPDQVVVVPEPNTP